MASAIRLPTQNPLILEGVDYAMKSARDALNHLGIRRPLDILTTPMLEAKMAPVLSEQRLEVDDHDRSPGRIC